MMAIFTVYSKATGAILHTLAGSLVDLIKDIGPDQDIIDGEWNGDIYYVLNGAATPRPTLAKLPRDSIPADGETPLLLTGLPPGTLISIGMIRNEFGLRVGKDDPHKYPFMGAVDDGALEWTSTIKGTYMVGSLPPFPYQSSESQVTVE